MMLRTPARVKDPRDRDARRAETDDQHLEILDAPARQLHRVQQRRHHDDRRAVLVVVEHRDIELRLEAILDLEAARRRDVLEVDAAEGRRDQLDVAHDLVGVGRVEADREGVDAGELLEQAALALHHRHRRARADVAEAEHRRAVGDDRHRVALDRVLEGLVLVFGDRLADARHARRVGHREVVARLQRAACCAVRSCRRRAAGTCDRSCRSPRRPAARAIAARICSQWSCPAASTTMSRRLCGPSISTRSTAPTMPPASPIAPVNRPSVPWASSMLDADRQAVLRAGCGAHWSFSSLIGRHGMLRGTAATTAARAALIEWAFDGRHQHEREDARRGCRRGRAAPVPDRRAQPRLPRLLRAARVDRDLDRRPDKRDLRLRLDAREDRHRVRRAADRRRLGRRYIRAHRDVRRVQGPAPLAPGSAQAAVARDGTARRGLRLLQREDRGLRGRRRDRLARRARDGGRAARARDDRDRRSRRLPADRRAGPGQGDGDRPRDHRDQDLRPPGGDRPLRHPARVDPRLLRPEGRHLRQHPRRPRDRRQDRQRAAADATEHSSKCSRTSTRSKAPSAKRT